MTPEQSYEKLCQIAFTNPNYIPGPGHSTFLVIQVTPDKNNSTQLYSTIVDPAVPDNGDAKDYIQLPSTMRLLLDIADIIGHIAPSMSSFATHGPFNEKILDAADNNPEKLCALLRHISRRTAIETLREVTPYE